MTGLVTEFDEEIWHSTVDMVTVFVVHMVLIRARSAYCAKVISNAPHTVSKVGSVGALFLLNIFVTVEWKRIPRAGKIPAPEEWLRYALERIKAEGRGDLLRWYPNL